MDGTIIHTEKFPGGKITIAKLEPEAWEVEATISNVRKRSWIVFNISSAYAIARAMVFGIDSAAAFLVGEPV